MKATTSTGYEERDAESVRTSQYGPYALVGGQRFSNCEMYPYRLEL